MNPEISLIVIAYREEARIGSAVRSILAQKTSADFELIVVDDGSDDKTSQMATRAALGDGRLHLIRFPENRGRGAARAAGLAAAAGRLIGFVDADIALSPDWLERCRAALPGYAAVGGIALPDGDSAVVARLSGARARLRRGSLAVTGNNALFDGSILRSIEFPDTRLGEDFRLERRLMEAGQRTRTVPGLVVAHAEHKSYRAGLRWLYTSGIDATALWAEFRLLRSPDLAWTGWLASLIVSLSLWPRLGPVALLLFVAVTGVIGSLHALTRFHLCPLAPFARAWLLDQPALVAYLLGRTVGVVVLFRSKS